MARIAGIDLPRYKRLEVALTYIYGIGRSRSRKILQKAKVNSDIHVIDLNDQEIAALRGVLDSDYIIEGDLRRFESLNIKRLMEINSYKGKRHRVGLPLRGQRTRTNARTRRGTKKNNGAEKESS